MLQPIRKQYQCLADMRINGGIFRIRCLFDGFDFLLVGNRCNQSLYKAVSRTFIFQNLIKLFTKLTLSCFVKKSNITLDQVIDQIPFGLIEHILPQLFCISCSCSRRPWDIKSQSQPIHQMFNVCKAIIVPIKWIGIVLGGEKVIPKAIPEAFPNTLILNPLIFAISVALRKHAHTYTSSLPLIRRERSISRCASKFWF